MVESTSVRVNDGGGRNSDTTESAACRVGRRAPPRAWSRRRRGDPPVSRSSAQSVLTCATVADHPVTTATTHPASPRLVSSAIRCAPEEGLFESVRTSDTLVNDYGPATALREGDGPCTRSCPQCAGDVSATRTRTTLTPCETTLTPRRTMATPAPRSSTPPTAISLLAPGARVEVRDEDWLITHVQETSGCACDSWEHPFACVSAQSQRLSLNRR